MSVAWIPASVSATENAPLADFPIFLSEMLDIAEAHPHEAEMIAPKERRRSLKVQ